MTTLETCKMCGRPTYGLATNGICFECLNKMANEKVNHIKFYKINPEREIVKLMYKALKEYAGAFYNKTIMKIAVEKINKIDENFINQLEEEINNDE
jgi:hypothetical protein